MVAAPNRLRNFTMAYLHATNALNRPPRNAEELKPYLTKIGDPKELLSSPRDGAEWIVHWGADLRKLPAQGDKSPVWLYEKNPHAGKRWVLRERNPMELADEEFRNSLFAPGFKPPF